MNTQDKRQEKDGKKKKNNETSHKNIRRYTEWRNQIIKVENTKETIKQAFNLDKSNLKLYGIMVQVKNHHST